MILSSVALAEHPGELALKLKRLGVTGSVLYVAAHPDDENTRLLAWLVGSAGVRTGYLSLTRGDGGQNLIGNEQGEQLGLIRTHELLAARRIDGAEQFFTRARDFGFSKSADETMRIWGHDEVLADVVLAIRRFQPDVIITRFNNRPPNHGHHTASSMLAEEAFVAAADPKRFPEQLRDGVTVWQADRLLWNTSAFFFGPNPDLSSFLKMDLGTYEPLLGRAYSELAADSRSQHKSQGFGVAAERGQLPEYFSPTLGTKPKTNIFEGLDFSWKRIAGADAVTKAIGEAASGFDLRAPAKSIPALLKVRAALAALPDSVRLKQRKLADVDQLIAACAGVFLEARAAQSTAVPGSSVKVDITAINRSSAAVTFANVTIGGAAPAAAAAVPQNKTADATRPDAGPSVAVDPTALLAFSAPKTAPDGGMPTAEGAAVSPKATLADNVAYRVVTTVTLPADALVTTPYWLREPQNGGLYTVSDAAMVGRPEADAPLVATFALDVAGQRIEVKRPVVFAWTDPVRGELFRQFEVAPEVTVTPASEVTMFANGATQPLKVTVAAGKKSLDATVKLELPSGWKSVPASAPVKLAAVGDEQVVVFAVTPPKNASERVKAKLVAEVSGRASSYQVTAIAHDHLPPLTIRRAAEVSLVPLTLATKVKRVGYIPGPGDRVAESLAQVGYEVTQLTDERLASEKLDKYEAIVVGVRAFNSNERLPQYHQKLMDYVAQGGRLLVQYNTNSRIGPLNSSVGPWPLEIGRDRVTDETATMTPLDKNEPLLKTPNALGAADFTGWVQERGLYFAAKWDEKYRPVLSMNDPNEGPSQGALLVGRHGKGVFVYTGLAFFRQLPAGVPGAYRLMANLLSQ